MDHHPVAAPQLRFYATQRAGWTVIIHRDSGTVAAWIEPVANGQLRARKGAWRSEPVDTIPQAVTAVADAWPRSR